MRDCSNAEMRDALPDLLHGRLDAAERSEVESHVAGCADCSAELELLERVRASHDARRPVVNVERIVQALPAQRRRASWMMTPGVRIAATLALLIGGATWYARTDRPEAARQPASPQVATVAPAAPDTVSDVGEPTPARAVKPPTRAVVAAAAPSLDGGLDDFSDAELRTLLAALDSFDAEVDPEPRTMLPVPETEGLR